MPHYNKGYTALPKPGLRNSQPLVATGATADSQCVQGQGIPGVGGMTAGIRARTWVGSFPKDGDLLKSKPAAWSFAGDRGGVRGWAARI